MNISDTIRNCAEKTFGISTVKPYQLLVTHRIIEQFNSVEEENQIVILPTGGGKSLCFLLPAVLCKKITIIIYPLLALMNDQMQKLQNLGIDCVVLKGGQSLSERGQIYSKLRHGTMIVITNPETLNQNSVRQALGKFEIEILAVDEAHVISQWGKDFRPAYVQLKETIQFLKPHQVLAFTATAGDQTIKDICNTLFVKEPIIVHSDTDRDNIYYSAYPVLSKDLGVAELLAVCQRPAVVFCGERRKTYELCLTMKRIFPDYQMRYYHAGLEKEERIRIETWFKNTDDAVLFTTCAYGMGVDIPGIRTIIHYDLPSDALEYLQESGRAGRDRKPATAWVLVPYKQKPDAGLMSVFTSDRCRHQALLEELGEYKEDCSGCDVCSKKVIRRPPCYGEIKSLIRFHPFQYTPSSAAGILSGDPFRSKDSFNPHFGVLDIDELLLRESVLQSDIKYVTTGKHRHLLYIDNVFNRLVARLLSHL